MRVVYEILKIIVKIGLWVYYRRRTVVNRAGLRFRGPAIVVSNHPCTLMDPLNVGVWAREQFYFLANAGLFKSKFGNWFFNTFYCIPIARMQDTGGKPVDNTANFARCDAHLVRGGTLYIAPEGDSWMRRHLMKLKTGTVRIAFNSEQQHDYQLDLKIIPVGLTYSDPTAFRGELFIQVGEPLYVRDFREAYENNAHEAIKSVTLVLQERLRTLMIDTSGDEEDMLVRQLETILQHQDALPPTAAFQRTKHLISALREWEAQDALSFATFKNQVAAYFQQLQKSRTSDAAVAGKSNGALLPILIWIILGLPIFLYGFVNHFLPAFVPFAVAWLLVHRMKLYIGYTSTVKFAIGVFTVPLFYWLQSKWVEQWFSTAVSWWYLLSLPLAGMLAWAWWALARKTRMQVNVRLLNSKNKLHEMRAQITDTLTVFFNPSLAETEPHASRR